MQKNYIKPQIAVLTFTAFCSIIFFKKSKIGVSRCTQFLVLLIFNRKGHNKMKKALSLFIALITCAVIFTSCTSAANDPVKLAKDLDESLDDYLVSIMVDKTDVERIADVLDISKRGIDCIVEAYLPDGYLDKRYGYFFYCEDKKYAERLYDDLDYNFEDLEDTVTRCMIIRSGKVVFFGCEDVWYFKE